MSYMYMEAQNGGGGDFSRSLALANAVGGWVGVSSLVPKAGGEDILISSSSAM